MSARVAKLSWSLLFGLVAVMAAGRAYAQTVPCNVDSDCPGTACGSQVCWMSSGSGSCVDPNTQGQSGFSDGWCSSSGDASASNCKCASLGATCEGFFCSFTVPPDGGAGGTAGTTGAGGTGTGGGSGGSTGSAGTSGGGGGGDGCCSVGGAPLVESSLGAVLLAAALMRRRGRRRV
jgi:hypothetical protein